MDRGLPQYSALGTVIVTGASRGVGFHLARHLAIGGWQVAICARQSEPLSAAAASIERDIAGRTVLARPLDVSDADAVRGFVDEISERLGPPRALINNAAVLGPVGPVDCLNLDEVEATLRVNVLGILAVIAAVVPRMDVRRGAAIVNLSGGGIGGPSTSPRLVAYTSSKAAVAALTETLGRELADRGIRVNAIAPGAVPTALTRPIVSAGPGIAGSALYEATVTDRARRLELSRLFDLVDFVLSDEAGWLNGRLLSARWDSPDGLRQARDRILSTSLYQLRRIDDDLYQER